MSGNSHADRQPLSEEEQERAAEYATKLGKQRFVDAVADSLQENIEEARRGLSSIRMCRDEEGKGGYSLTNSDISKLEYGLTIAAEQARHINSKIKGEQ